MNNSLKVSILAAAIAAALPSWVSAAGLGGINVFSALGQPLRAEIELQATAEEMDGMVAEIPGPEAFRRANVPFSPLMQNIEVSIDRSSTRPVLRINSTRAINEPFVDLLIEVSWAAGRLTREYTLLLDPVERRPVAAPAAAPTPVPARRAAAPITTSGEHVVRRGDTLHRIARDHLPEGAHLEQMLVALLQANEHAFADGNMNRLRANSTLRIPDELAVASVSVLDARREVLAQTQAFEAYRRRVAGTVAARPSTPAPAPSREREGVVEPRVADIVRDPAAGDQVQVSGAPPVVEVAADVPAPVASAAVAVEEELFARERELDEANSRIAELEATVRDLQRALEMTNETLARLQADRETTPAPRAGSDEPAVRPAPRPAPPPPVPQAQPSMLETLTGNPLLLGGGALVLGLLALLGIRIARRRREEAEFISGPDYAEPTTNDTPSVVSVPGGERVDTDSSTGPSSVMDSDFSQTGLSAIDANEGVDPVAEADVYLAYGRDAQAEEILLDALKVDASRHAIYLKLLEVYEQRGDRRQFEVIATDLYGRTGGEGPDWQKAVAMGRRVDPDNPLYGGGGGTVIPPVTSAEKSSVPSAATIAGGAAAATAAAVAAGAGSDPEADTVAPLPELDESVDDGSLAAIAEDSEEVVSLDFNLDEEEAALPDEASEGVVAQPGAVDENMLAFDLDLGDGEAPEVEAGPQAESLELPQVEEPLATEESTFMDLERTEFDANVLDFDLDLSEPDAAAAEKADVSTTAEMDLSSVDTDLDSELGGDPVPAQRETEAARPAAGAVPEFAAEDVQREMDTKLELARAYDEMGDREGARELLEEVIKEGSAEQREMAQQMLEKLV